MFDKLHEECGVFGVLGRATRPTSSTSGCTRCQHRGQESAGIASVNADGRIVSEREMGHVAEVFTQERIARLPGEIAIGHVRYSTAGGRCSATRSRCGLHEQGTDRRRPQRQPRQRRGAPRPARAEGAIFNTMSDTEVIVHLIARSKEPDLERAFIDRALAVQGAYAIALLSHDRILAARDPYGFRPLVLGKLDDLLAVSSDRAPST